MTIYPIVHRQTKMYVIGSGGKHILFDCLWHDSFPVIKSAFKERGITFAQIAGMFISHFHPDHAGAFGLLQQHGVTPMVLEWQMPHIEWLNSFFTKPKNDPAGQYIPINVKNLMPITLDMAGDFLQSCGIDGKIIRTPGHSDDSISLIAGNAAFVGDLPRFETADSCGSEVAASWREISALNAAEIYYAH
jgi:glyoxylase-like metal-dependent hydrolase (beta-lactamase superfamily II)